MSASLLNNFAVLTVCTVQSKYTVVKQTIKHVKGKAVSVDIIQRIAEDTTGA